MPNQDRSIDDIISDLDKYEKRLLRLLGSEHLSKHKNLRLETIKDRLPDEYGKEVDKAISSLRCEGLIFSYRHKDYGLSPLGVKVAQRIVKEFNKERYGDLRILMIV